jgi:ribosomal protein S18 acetylase RimI-like enzyme
MALLPAVGDVVKSCGTRILRVVHGRDARATLLTLSRIQIERVRLESFAMNDAGSANSISLRPAAPEDAAFLLALFKSSRGDDLRGLGWEEDRISEFLAMQHEAQQRFHTNEYKKPIDQIILLHSEPVGRLIFESREHEIRCVDIALLPEHRNSGIGGHLIRNLQTEAKRQRKALRLQVIRFSRAIGLFERLGFQRISETGTHFQMEWTPE